MQLIVSVSTKTITATSWKFIYLDKQLSYPFGEGFCIPHLQLNIHSMKKGRQESNSDEQTTCWAIPCLIK